MLSILLLGTLGYMGYELYNYVNYKKVVSVVNTKKQFTDNKIIDSKWMENFLLNELTDTEFIGVDKENY